MKRTRKVQSLLAASVMTPLLLASTACGGGDNANTDSAGGTVAMSDSAGATSGGANDTGTPNNSGQSDASVAQLLAVVNRNEIAAGRLAGTKARNADVKAYARQMVDEHQRAMQQLTTLASSTGWTVDSSSMSGMMGTGTGTGTGIGTGTGTGAGTGAGATGGTGTMAGSSNGSSTAIMQQMNQTNMNSMQTLRGATGAAFDRAYMDSQVAAHRQTLDVLRQHATSLQNNELRTHVTQLQGSIEQHLQQATDIRTRLGGTTGAGARGTGGTP